MLFVMQYLLNNKRQIWKLLVSSFWHLATASIKSSEKLNFPWYTRKITSFIEKTLCFYHEQEKSYGHSVTFINQNIKFLTWYQVQWDRDWLLLIFLAKLSFSNPKPGNGAPYILLWKILPTLICWHTDH